MNETLSLVDLACRSALLRIKRCFVAGGESSPYLVGEIADDMRRFARQCRADGIDARASSLWPLVEYKALYEEVFERNRRVVVQHLTPMIIYQCLERGNQLWHDGWKVIVGGSREVTGDFGEPSWESRIWIETPNGELLEDSGISRRIARRIYERIAGHPFAGVDTLGQDGPHPAERISHGDMLDYLEREGRRLLAADDSGPLWDAFVTLSVEDPSACLARFDDNGRYLDAHTGFWVSLHSERYDERRGEWYRRFDATDESSATCIGCGCTHERPCWLDDDVECSTCTWLKIDRALGVGVCSECADLQSGWDAGERTPRGVTAGHNRPDKHIEDN